MENDLAQTTLQRLNDAGAAIRDARLGVEQMMQSRAVDHIVTGANPFVFHLAIFVLAIFVGYYVVWSVTPALHTPLMAVTNAISSVIIVGAILSVGLSASGIATGFGFVALVLASVNIFGGFLVTHRMLAMYKKKEK
jgi:NAD(P) transhydrogenase subunit alpha